MSVADIYDKFWSRLQLGRDTYEYFTYCGNIPMMPIPSSPNYENVQGNLVIYIQGESRSRLEDLKGDYVFSRPSRNTLDISVRKMDRKVNYSFRTDPAHYRALGYIESMFREALTTRHMTLEEVMLDIDWTKATGVAWTNAGFKHKSDVLRSGMVKAVLDESTVLKVKPVWKAVGKEEFRTRRDYVDLAKQRTFIIEPFELLFHRKRLFGLQNERMKCVGWSAYGINPYEGGVWGMARRLTKNKHFFMLDGKLWDRIFALLNEVYEMRTKYIPDDPFIKWVVENGICSYVILPNGDIVFKTWGNNSGSGCTTGDNILGMCVCVAHVFFYLGITESQLDQVVMYAFGDDVLGSHSFDFTDQEMEAAFKHVFGLYGVELDPFVSGDNLEDFSFLGFSFKKLGDYWIPKYPLERLAYSFLYEPNSVKVEAEISKMCSLMLMSAGNGEDYYNLFRSSLCDVLLNCDCPTAIQLRHDHFRSVPVYNSVINWYLGLEGVDTYFSKFLQVSSFCEGGWKEQKE